MSIKKTLKKVARQSKTKKKPAKLSSGKSSGTKNAKTEKSASAKRSGVAKKKRTVSPRKKSNKRIFVTVTEEKYFWVNNGPVLKDLRDLYKALKTINKDQFIYHAHGDNNDFALWVEYVLLDKECAKALTKAKTQKATVKKVSEVLKKYK